MQIIQQGFFFFVSFIFNEPRAVNFDCDPFRLLQCHESESRIKVHGFCTGFYKKLDLHCALKYIPHNTSQLRGLTCSPCVCVGFLIVLQFPPTCPRAPLTSLKLQLRLTKCRTLTTELFRKNMILTCNHCIQQGHLFTGTVIIHHPPSGTEELLCGI